MVEKKCRRQVRESVPFGEFTIVRVSNRVAADSTFPSWACGLVQSSMRSAGIRPVWLARIPSAVIRFRIRPWGLPIRPSRVDGLVSARAPLLKFRHPSGPCTDEACQCKCAGSSRGLSSRMTHAATEVRFTRARPAPGTFRPQGLVTPSTVSSLGGLVDPVSDRQRLSGSPFGALIPAES